MLLLIGIQQKLGIPGDSRGGELFLPHLEEEARSVEMRRRQARFTKRLTPILNLLDPKTIRQYFGTDDHEEIWRELNTGEEHRGRVVEWFTMITTKGN
jgi:hypothetical protein